LTLLSGIYYPVDVLPQPLRALSACIPVTYFLRYFRSFFGFEAKGTNPLLPGYGLAIIYLVLALAGMFAAVRHSKKTGVLLKMSE
jgi:ABC-2 type transport system permease protein